MLLTAKEDKFEEIKANGNAAKVKGCGFQIGIYMVGALSSHTPVVIAMSYSKSRATHTCWPQAIILCGFEILCWPQHKHRLPYGCSTLPVCIIPVDMVVG